MEIIVVLVVLSVYILIELLIRKVNNHRSKNPSSHDYIDDLNPPKCSPKESCLNCLYTKGCPHFASLEYDASYTGIPIREYIKQYGDN